MRIININDIKVKVFEKKELIEKLGFTEDAAKVVMKYQKIFPELLQDEAEEFAIDARTLWEQLKVGTRFNDWITDRIEKYKYVENTDFICITEKKVTQRSDGQKGLTQIIEYKLTLESAKKIAVRQNNEMGNLVCDYFILVEKALRNYEQWTAVRQPQKIGHKQLCEALDKQYRAIYNRKTPSYIYSNESDMLNRALLGNSAKAIGKLLGSQDKLTREHFEVEINKALYELQTMDIGLMMAGLEFETRKNTIDKICKTKYISILIQVQELQIAI